MRAITLWSHKVGNNEKNHVDTTNIKSAILSQASPTNDFMMPNQHFDLVPCSNHPLFLRMTNKTLKGNDDQVFWALTAMSAAEYSFPNPSAPSWIELATNAFDDMTTRWNTTQCNGGLKWQIFPENNGYDYKSSIANGGFFQLAARLARYTGNVTYVEWAEKSWDWMTGIGLISGGFNVFDGSDDTINCTGVDHDQWTYNNAVFIYGSAMLANISDESSPWANRTRGFLSAAGALFFTPFPNATNVMFEAQCEKAYACDNDQYSFKAYLGRWLYATAKMLPELQSDILALMRPTAEAAATSCSGGTQQRTCGTEWWLPGFGGAVGLGQQMSALEVIHGLLLDTVKPPGIAASTTSTTKEHARKHMLRAKRST